ncbi:MAG: hypothetical protein ACOX6V_02250 [Patescibacteria group bacterium]|jgi:hypothetical protein
MSFEVHACGRAVPVIVKNSKNIDLFALLAKPGDRCTVVYKTDRTGLRIELEANGIIAANQNGLDPALRFHFVNSVQRGGAFLLRVVDPETPSMVVAAALVYYGDTVSSLSLMSGQVKCRIDSYLKEASGLGFSVA